MGGGLDTEALNGLLAAREERASIGISFVIILLGFMIVIAAFEDFARGKKEEHKETWVLYYISFFSMIVFGGLGLVKFRFSKMLSSESLYKDGICSMVGAILSASLFCNTVLYIASSGGAWWLDPIVALICGLGSLVYGLHGIYIAYVVEGLPIFSRKWWKLKRSLPSSSTNTATTTTTDIENGGRGPATPTSMGSAGPILMQDHHGSTLTSPYGQDVTNDIVVKRPITTTAPTPTTTTTTSPSNINTTTALAVENDLVEPIPATTTTSVPPMNAFTPEKAEVSKVPSRSSEDGDDYDDGTNNNNKDDDSITEIELT